MVNNSFSNLINFSIFGQHTNNINAIFSRFISGFDVVDKGCCGTGDLEVMALCNRWSRVCQDKSKHLFWDSYHPSEQGYKVLVNLILKDYINQFF